ncbi:phosphate ABC transporter substrate-binding protein [bacterium]|nr:phosphate ABC transporter substrate-binding protein [bacterium]
MTKQFRISLLTTISAVVIGGMVALGSSAFAATTIVMDGSTTVGPIAKAFAEYYMKTHPSVNITISESGSGNGVKSLLNGKCDIANLSRFMKPNEFSACVAKGIMPVAHTIAMDGVAPIVHPSNGVKALTMKQLKGIYTGKITNWKQLGGPDMKIVVISRDTNSGTYETFEKKVMSKEKMGSGVEYVGSNGAVRQRVQSTQAAIGYVGLGFVDKTVKSLPVNGVSATLKTVAAGTYPIARPLYMFTNGYPELGGHVHALVTMHYSEKGQEIIESLGFVPLTSY